MSVAYELDSYPHPDACQASSAVLSPVLSPAPVRALRAVPALEPVALPPARERVASVSVLHAPEDDVAPVRLTRRGVVVLSVLVAALAGALVWVAALSSSDAAAPRVAGPAVVTVQPGDTLWSIAGRVAPGSDPRTEIATLEQLNGTSGADLVAGQRLRLR